MDGGRRSSNTPSKASSRRRSSQSSELSAPTVYKTRPFRDPVRKPKKHKRINPAVFDELSSDHVKVKVSKLSEGNLKRLGFNPSMETRLDLAHLPSFIYEPGQPRIQYAPPQTKKQMREYKERRELYEQLLNFCKYNEFNLPKPSPAKRISGEITSPSPEVSKAKVLPKKPSMSASRSYPDLPEAADLEAKKPKSGIIINETKPKADEGVDSFDLVYQRKPRPGYDTVLSEPKKKKKKKRKKILVEEEDGTEEYVDAKEYKKILKKQEKERRHLEREERRKMKKEAKELEKQEKKDRKKRRDSASGDEVKTEIKEEPVDEEILTKIKQEPLSADPFNTEKEQYDDFLTDIKQEPPEIKEENIPGGFETILEEYEGESEGESEVEETYLTKLFRRKVSQISKTTSVNEKELNMLPVPEDEESVEIEPAIHKLIQKFRRDSEEQRYKPPKRKIRRGTLESHSFTKIKQKTLKDFIFGSMGGSVHPGSPNFSSISRDNQGICMPIAAYCCLVLKHPNEWKERTIDDILEAGDELYVNSLSNLHEHEQGKELTYQNLDKYCYIDKFKMQFEVGDPYVSGRIKSKNKTVYNLTKALRIFFRKHRAGILQTTGYNILIWKDKFFYMFDPSPRAPDLYTDLENGTSHMANFYDIPGLVSIFLKRTDMGNWPFTISKISVVKIKHKDAPDDDDRVHGEGSIYNIVDSSKAVVVGTFDLGDRCFEFSRNKQALAMAVVCLTYSKISPPTSWRRRTIDKILIIGNQLYNECLEGCEPEEDLQLDQLPAIYTIGPYMVNLTIYANIYADVMWKKSQWQFTKCLLQFFENNNNAIIQIGKYSLAVWFQRDLYYCFDPYSRNNEALKCRSGSACVSMNASLDTVCETITTNFDEKEVVFYIHALKVLKIQRDPELSKHFPRSIGLDAYPLEKFKHTKMRKSKAKATEKPVTIDNTEMAMKKLLAGEGPEPSILEVGSNIGSLTSGELPPMCTRHIEELIKTSILEQNAIADLDSPSLSDTQIEPELPRVKEEDAEKDEESFDLTVEEQELMGGGEDEGNLLVFPEGGEMGGGDYEDYMGEGEDVDEIDEMYLAMSVFAQVGSHSLQSYHSKISEQINTELTYGYLPLKLKPIYPENVREKMMAKRERERRSRRQSIYEKEPPLPEVTQSQELAKESNFVDLPDGTQLVRGGRDMSAYGGDTEFTAPFVCMMAAAVAKKFELRTWSGQVVDYVLKCGAELYKAAKVRYDQVPVLEIPRVSLGRTDFTIFVEYLFDSTLKPEVLKLSLEKILFPLTECGIVVTPNYACAVFFHNALYYLYDGFANNELGMSDGPDEEGVACLSRFKTLQAMVSRIMYNKTKRDKDRSLIYTRFVLSSCVANRIRPDEDMLKRRKKSRREKMAEEIEREQAMMGEDGQEDEIFEEPEDAPEKEKPKQKKKKDDNKVGYQYKNKQYVIEGTKSLTGRTTVSTELKTDHFVCLCTAMMLLLRPIKKWDTKTVDYVIDQGKHIFSHAEDLDVSEKRTIRNVLIHKYFFDVVVKRIEIVDWQDNKNLETGIDTLLRKKRHYFLIQFPNTCYVIHVHNDTYHLFDPYGRPGKGKKRKPMKAGWTKYKNVNKLKRKIRKDALKGAETYAFYNFEILSIKKAPKKIVLGQRMAEYEKSKEKREEHIAGEEFFEDETWLEVDPIPWSRLKAKSTKAKTWHEWTAEIPHLYSLYGTIHQTSTKFEEKTRGKQTLANLVVAIAMTDIYDLSEWNAAIMDSILVNGDAYFKECVKDNDTEDYEIEMDDLINECSIFPFSFNVYFSPVVEGTVFLVRLKQFNLYKALRAFFDKFESRCGIICVTKGERKRHVAFGKVQEKEYFVYDCEIAGLPMFTEGSGTAYVLRCTSFKRLLHVLTVTVRGGDFYIYNVEVTNFKALA